MANGAHTEAFLDAVTELYAAAEALCDLDQDLFDSWLEDQMALMIFQILGIDEVAIAADQIANENEVGNALARLRAAMEACDATGQIVQLTEMFQQGKVSES